VASLTSGGREALEHVKRKTAEEIRSGIQTNFTSHAMRSKTSGSKQKKKAQTNDAPLRILRGAQPVPSFLLDLFFLWEETNHGRH
jgi:hypothetical protein